MLLCASGAETNKIAHSRKGVQVLANLDNK
jgi:hypothetical protein